mgnify:CR=1 FL=1
MKLTIGICTYNRDEIWENGEGTFRCLLQQSDMDFELLICDDNSTDRTLDAIREILKTDHPCMNNTRFFQCRSPKKLPRQGQAMPENVLFAEASGDYYLHIDDDGMVDPDMVKFAKRLIQEMPTGAFYGRLRFINPKTGAPYSEGGTEYLDDERMKYVTAAVQPGPNVIRLQPEFKAEWGGLWLAPLKPIRQIGGHELELSHFRGEDARLGSRMAFFLPTYFVCDQNFTFTHYGLTHRRYLALRGNVGEFLEMYREPSAGNYAPTLFTNGQESFWTSDALRSQYHEVSL